MRHTVSFKHAFDGLFYTFKTQPNLRIHLAITMLVLIAGVIFHLSRPEWVIIIFTIMWVITTEMVNTAVESMVDLLTTEIKPQAKIAKDVAAGMVLLGAIGAVIVGLIIFVPHLG